VSKDSENLGQMLPPESLKPMDCLTIYANSKEQNTHVYLREKPEKSNVYWRIEGLYDSATEGTKRTRGADGAYSIDFYCDGELVTLKCKDKKIVDYIDYKSEYKAHFGFAFDEEGYIIKRISSEIGIQARGIGEGYDVTYIEDEEIELTSTIWNNAGDVENFKLENLYDLVRSGKWTIDKMAELCAAVSGDLNGNNQVDKDDRFGLLAETTTLQYFVTAGGVRFSDRDKDGELYLSVYGDRVVGIVEEMVPLLNSAEMTMMNTKYAAGYNNVYFDLFLPVFFDNRALFYSNQLLVALEMRSMDGDFGILPTPKYDEAQKEYYTIGNTAWSENVIIPATSTDLDMIGHVIDAYGWQAQKYITPAFVDYTVLDKSIRDEDSAEMVELILDTQTFDLAYIFNWGKCRSMLDSLVTGNNTNYASASEGIKSAAEAAMAATVAEIKGK
jgi:hypothetical protein